MQHPAVLLLSRGEQMAGDGGEMVGEGQVWSQSAGVHCSLHLDPQLLRGGHAVNTANTQPDQHPVGGMHVIYLLIYLHVC